MEAQDLLPYVAMRLACAHVSPGSWALRRIAMARLTALRIWRLRRIAAGDVFGRLVAGALANAWTPTINQATRPRSRRHGHARGHSMAAALREHLARSLPCPPPNSTLSTAARSAERRERDRPRWSRDAHELVRQLVRVRACRTFPALRGGGAGHAVGHGPARDRRDSAVVAPPGVQWQEPPLDQVLASRWPPISVARRTAVVPPQPQLRIGQKRHFSSAPPWDAARLQAWHCSTT